MREKMSDPDIEYVLVDGKSNDKTMEIVRKYREFIDMCISEKDDGIYDAINKGIKHSTGDYTLFLAADDVLLENLRRVFCQKQTYGVEVQFHL